jgi:putative membrane protein
MALVSEPDRKRIAETITAAERKTSGEIVAVVAAESASYMSAPLLWGSAAALLLPWPLIFLTWWPVQWIYLLQLLVFLALVLILMQRPLRYALVPQSIKHQRAHRRAVEQFLAQNLHTTEGRTGVLIFVSAAERYAEILADAGIRSRVAAGRWQAIVDELTRAIGDGRPGDGFVTAIEAVGIELARHFPPGSADPSQLPNHLIVLE